MQYMIEKEERERGTTINAYSSVDRAGKERLRKDTAIRVSQAQRRTGSVTSLAWHIEDSSTVLRVHSSNYTFSHHISARPHAFIHLLQFFPSLPSFLPDET